MLLGCARSARRSPPAAPPGSAGSPGSLAVLIPAHDEATQVAATIASLHAGDYPADARRIIVIADNCSDRTAEVARDAGAEVWERTDDAHRGKGQALRWACDRLLAEPEAPDAVCVVDADCEVSANLLRALWERLATGAEAVQAAYLIASPEASTAAALRWAGFALVNYVRPLGRERLGLSAGLLGTGMAFSAGLLRRAPWRAFSFAEDREQHLSWVLAGTRVAFAPDACVLSPAAPSRAAAAVQEARWESGRGTVLRRLTPRLVLHALRHGDPVALDAAWETLVLPQSALLAAGLSGTLLGALSRRRELRDPMALTLAAQIVYVLGGLHTAHAPPAAWRALATAPGFAIRRLRALAGQLGARGPSSWQRTPRADS